MLLERFLRYVAIDTKADETSTAVPSTPGQLVLAAMLRDECLAMGLRDVSMSEHGVVVATLPGRSRDGRPSETAPTIGWIAHVDTSPEYTGTNVRPVIHRNYQGTDLALPGDPAKVLRPSEFPELKTVLGHTLITTDGTTLLGADDKAGVAVIMQAAAELVADTSIEHGPVRVVFTCDEEIGRGTDHLDVPGLGCVCAYTLDGGGTAQVDCETFSAEQAIITVHGINTHPSIGKDSMVNAVRILSEFISRLPRLRLSPETTDGRDGFVHPYHIEGGVAEATARLILRDFESSALLEQSRLLEQIAASLRVEYPRANIQVTVRPQYRNMREGLVKEPRAVRLAEEAVRAVGMTPERSIIRGGTDGSLLTAKGLPTPNLSCGQHNPHSPLEWASLDEMQAAVRVLKHLAMLWGRER